MHVYDVDIATAKLTKRGRITCMLLRRVRNEKNRLSQIRLDGVSACTVLRPEYKTHKQKDACLVGVAVDLFCEQGRYREESFCLPILSCLRL